MKFNLKNRPKEDLYFAPVHSLSEMEKWFEGFEKELRELQKKHDVENDEWEHGYWSAIEEILGED